MNLYRIILNEDKEIIEKHKDFQSVLDKYGRGVVTLIEQIEEETSEGE